MTDNNTSNPQANETHTNTHTNTQSQNNTNWSNLGTNLLDSLRTLWRKGAKRHLALRSRKGNTYFRVPFNILAVVFLLLVMTRLVWLAVIAALIAAFVFKVQFVIITDGVVQRTFNQASPPAETTPETSSDVNIDNNIDNSDDTTL